jgi:cell division protein FtsB
MKAIKAAQNRVNGNAAPWIGGIAVFISVLGFLGAFLFNEVTAAPKIYETIEQHQRDVDKQERDRQMVEDKIDKGFDKIYRLILDLHKK